MVNQGGAFYDKSSGKWINASGYNATGGGSGSIGGASNQDIRNLNRMYPDGNVPTSSKYSSMVNQGGAIYDTISGKWVNSSGYSGTGTGTGTGTGGSGSLNSILGGGTNIASNQDIRNLNRMYPDGNVPRTSRFSALVESELKTQLDAEKSGLS